MIPRSRQAGQRESCRLESRVYAVFGRLKAALQTGETNRATDPRGSMDDQPLRAPPVPESHRVKLAGAYQATIKGDSVTGSLLSKEAVMELKGTAPMPSARTGTFGDRVPITAKATVTVEPLPWSPVADRRSRLAVRRNRA